LKIKKQISVNFRINTKERESRYYRPRLSWKCFARNWPKRNRKLDAKRNEHDLLKSLIDSMEGYPESIKFCIITQTGTILRQYYQILFM
jgi:hypothetical protein